MPSAQGDKVGCVGGATVFPVGDVVDVQPEAAATARNGTATVSMLDQAADPAGHNPLISTQVDRGAISFEHRAQLGVTGVEQSKVLGQYRAQVERQHVGAPGIGAGFEMGIDPVAI